MMLQISLSLYLVIAIAAIVIWAALLLGFFRVSKRARKARPAPETFTFFQPKRGGSFKNAENLIIKSRLDDLYTKILSYQNILVFKSSATLPLPIEEYSEFANNGFEPPFALFSNEEIQASVSEAQQNLEEIIAKRKERKAESFELERYAAAATVGSHGR